MDFLCRRWLINSNGDNDTKKIEKNIPWARIPPPFFVAGQLRVSVFFSGLDFFNWRNEQNNLTHKVREREWREFLTYITKKKLKASVFNFIMLRITRGLLSRQGQLVSRRAAELSGLVREQSFEKSLHPDLREFVSEAFDIFDLNNVRVFNIPLCSMYINREAISISETFPFTFFHDKRYLFILSSSSSSRKYRIKSLNCMKFRKHMRRTKLQRRWFVFWKNTIWTWNRLHLKRFALSTWCRLWRDVHVVRGMVVESSLRICSRNGLLDKSTRTIVLSVFFWFRVLCVCNVL